MRIALVTDWFAPRPGGIEAQLQQLATGLAGRGHEVHVLTSTPADGASVDPFTVTRLHVTRLPVAGVAIGPTLPAVLRRALGRERFDVVHAHVSVVSPVGYAGAFAARRLGLPVVVTFHSVLRAKRAALRLAHTLVGLGRARVTWSAVSTLVAGQVGAALPGAAVTVLPNGTDLSFWAATASVGRPAPVRLVSAMRFHRKKRPVALLRAFARALRQSGAPATLTLVGDGPELPAMRRAARSAGLEDARAVEFLPWRSRAALLDLYGDSHAFVLPSIHEAFGIAALEARAAGLPVVAMAAAGCREFLRDEGNALLCADDAALAAAMARIISDAALRERLAHASSDLSAYDWGAVLATHERAYAAARDVSGA